MLAPSQESLAGGLPRGVGKLQVGRRISEGPWEIAGPEEKGLRGPGEWQGLGGGLRNGRAWEGASGIAGFGNGRIAKAWGTAGLWVEAWAMAGPGKGPGELQGLAQGIVRACGMVAS